MKRKYQFTLRINFDHPNYMEGLKTFISVVHCRCPQGHKFYLSRLMTEDNWFLFFVLYGQGIEFMVKEIVYHEKKN